MKYKISNGLIEELMPLIREAMIEQEFDDYWDNHLTAGERREGVALMVNYIIGATAFRKRWDEAHEGETNAP